MNMDSEIQKKTKNYSDCSSDKLKFLEELFGKIQINLILEKFKTMILCFQCSENFKKVYKIIKMLRKHLFNIS